MKNAWMLRVVMGAAGLVTLGIPCAYAQAEIDPDHFAMPNTEPFQAPHAVMQNQSVQAAHNDHAMPARVAKQTKESASLGASSASVKPPAAKVNMTPSAKAKAISLERIDMRNAVRVLGAVSHVWKGEMRQLNPMLAA